MESRRQTYITLGGLVVLAVVLFTISGIDRFKNGHGLDGVIGGIGWFGGLLTVLLIIVLIGRTIVVARRRNRRSAGMAS
jgi:TM2 domain-containing membrane protein YozV